jgi:hypothetical protein
LFGRLIHLRMPHAVPVRQANGLPRASFRSRLAADTLASGYVLGATSCTRDFHPLNRAHAEHTEKNGPRRKPQTVSQPNQISEDQSEIFKRIREPLDQSGLPTQKRG